MFFAMVFPGQGAQSVGMLADLAATYPLVKHTFEQASEALSLDLWALSQSGPEDLLNQTDKTQPALLAASIAVARVWDAQGGTKPAICAGHSLGEYSALTYAGALDFEEAIRLVAERGRLMQQAVPAGVGAMAAILGLGGTEVQQACATAAQGQVVSAVNFNAQGQVVIAGHKAAVERAILAAKAAGAKKAVLLSVSVPSHCIVGLLNNYIFIIIKHMILYIFYFKYSVIRLYIDATRRRTLGRGVSKHGNTAPRYSCAA